MVTKRPHRDPPLVLMVTLTPRQEQQLLAVADELGAPLHAVGQEAIRAFLEEFGHRRRGRVRSHGDRVRVVKHLP